MLLLHSLLHIHGEAGWWRRQDKHFWKLCSIFYFSTVGFDDSSGWLIRWWDSSGFDVRVDSIPHFSFSKAVGLGMDGEIFDRWGKIQIYSDSNSNWGWTSNFVWQQLHAELWDYEAYSRYRLLVERNLILTWTLRSWSDLISTVWQCVTHLFAPTDLIRVRSSPPL